MAQNFVQKKTTVLWASHSLWWLNDLSLHRFDTIQQCDG